MLKRAGFVGQMGPRRQRRRGNPFLVNFRSGPYGNVAAFHAAKAQMGSGYRPRVLYPGDSKPEAYNVGGTGFVNASALSVTKKAADLCSIGGLPANKDLAFFSQGVNNSPPLYSAYDPRFNLGSDWTVGTSTTLAGNALRSQSPAVGALQFMPDGVVDSVTIWYISTSTAGTFTVSDGVTITGTTSTMAASGVRSVTHPLASRGSGKTISINRTIANAGQVQIVGVIAFDSQTPSLDIVNAGRYGTKASVEWISSGNTWSALNVIPAFDPDLTVIALGSNDLLGLVSPATFSSAMQSIIDASKLGGGSVVLVNPTKGLQPTYGTAQAQADYSAAILQLALDNDIPMIDEGAMFVDFATANANGLFSDNIHENVAGTDLRAALHAELLLNA